MSTHPTDPDEKDDRKGIDWKNSKARDILLMDLKNGVLPLDETELSASEAWRTVYGILDDFVHVPFKQFEKQLQAHREQVKHANMARERDAISIAYDRKLYPSKIRNHRNEVVFDKSPAQPLLREDVKNGLHERMTVGALKAMRSEYTPFKDFKFRERIYQEVRRQKFMYYMEWKRAKKEVEKKKKQQAEEKRNKADDAMVTEAVARARAMEEENEKKRPSATTHRYAKKHK